MYLSKEEKEIIFESIEYMVYHECMQDPKYKKLLKKLKGEYNVK